MFLSYIIPWYWVAFLVAARQLWVRLGYIRIINSILTFYYTSYSLNGL